jgi:hypothetical protein
MIGLQCQGHQRQGLRELTKYQHLFIRGGDGQGQHTPQQSSYLPVPGCRTRRLKFILFLFHKADGRRKTEKNLPRTMISYKDAYDIMGYPII